MKPPEPAPIDTTLISLGKGRLWIDTRLFAIEGRGYCTRLTFEGKMVPKPDALLTSLPWLEYRRRSISRKVVVGTESANWAITGQ